MRPVGQQRLAVAARDALEGAAAGREAAEGYSGNIAHDLELKLLCGVTGMVRRKAARACGVK